MTEVLKSFTQLIDTPPPEAFLNRFQPNLMRKYYGSREAHEHFSEVSVHCSHRLLVSVSSSQKMGIELYALNCTVQCNLLVDCGTDVVAHNERDSSSKLNSTEAVL